MQPHQQRRWSSGIDAAAGIARRIEETVAVFAVAQPIDEGLRMRQVILRQRSLAATQHLDAQVVAVDRQKRRQASGRRRDAVERPGIRGQSGEPVPVRGQAPLAAVRFAQEQLPAAGLDATEQQPSLSQRQVAASAQCQGAPAWSASAKRPANATSAQGRHQPSRSLSQ